MAIEYLSADPTITESERNDLRTKHPQDLGDCHHLMLLDYEIESYRDYEHDDSGSSSEEKLDDDSQDAGADSIEQS